MFSQAQVVDLDHGMKDKNPIEFVYFYSKRNPTKASTVKDFQVFMTLKLFYSRSLHNLSQWVPFIPL